jgi:hypothetical protein
MAWSVSTQSILTFIYRVVKMFGWIRNETHRKLRLELSRATKTWKLKQVDVQMQYRTSRKVYVND